jgi:hypothetical protein
MKEVASASTLEPQLQKTTNYPLPAAPPPPPPSALARRCVGRAKPSAPVDLGLLQSPTQPRLTCRDRGAICYSAYAVCSLMALTTSLSVSSVPASLFTFPVIVHNQWRPICPARHQIHISWSLLQPSTNRTPHITPEIHIPNPIQFPAQRMLFQQSLHSRLNRCFPNGVIRSSSPASTGNTSRPESAP